MRLGILHSDWYSNQAVPIQVLDDARRVVSHLEEREAEGLSTAAAPRRRSLAEVYDLAHKLACVAHSWAQDPDSVDPVKHLKALRGDARAALRAAAEDATEGPD